MVSPPVGATECKGGRPWTGDRPTVGYVLVRQPGGEHEKRARGWDHWREVLDRDVVLHQGQPARGFVLVLKPRGQNEKEAWAGTAAPTMEDEAWRDHFGSVYGGPVRQ